MKLRSHPVAAVVTVVGIAFLWVPVITVVVNSFNVNTLMDRWGGVTGHWYRQAIQDSNVTSGLRTTLIVAATSTAISLVLAVSASLWWRHASPRARAIYDALMYSRIIMPEVVTATALFVLFLKLHLPLGVAAVVVGHSVWGSAYATIVIQARVAGLDAHLEEAAADLGATPWRTFRRVTFASLVPAVLAGGLLAFTLSFDDVITSAFLQGSGTSTLPVVLFGLIRFRVTPEVNAIGVMIMLFTVALMAGAASVLSLASGRRQRSSALTALYQP